MPELPEVQTIVNQLKDHLTGKKIEQVEVLLAKSFVGKKELVAGRKIIDVHRRAKMIIIDLDGPHSLVIHLKMTGQLIYSDSNDGVTFPNPIPFAGTTLPAKTTHVVFHLNKGTLFFNDMRQFGWVKVMNDEEVKKMDEKHGPEALGKDFTPEYLTQICAKWGRPIKLLLLEQAKIAGVGNIYANEALWCARINPTRKGKDLDEKEIKKLHGCIQEVLEKGLKYGGSSASDEAFVNALGGKGHMQEHFEVYEREGLACHRGDGKIAKIKIGGRGTYFCPSCQR